MSSLSEMNQMTIEMKIMSTFMVNIPLIKLVDKYGLIS